MEKVIKECLAPLKSRLNDLDGNVFKEEDLKNFILVSINANCPFLEDDIDGTGFKSNFHKIISHAVYQALFAASIKEKGREFVDTNSDLKMNGGLAEFLLHASKQEFDIWTQLCYKEDQYR